MINNPFTISYIASALISFGLMTYIFMRRKEGMSSYIYLLLTCTAGWSLFYGLELAATSSDDIKFYLQMEYIGISLLPVFYLFYIITYTRAEKFFNKSFYPFFFVIPLVTIAMVISNDVHHLFYAQSSFKTLGYYYYHAFVPGPFYYIHVVYSYSLIATGIVLLLKTYKGQNKTQRANILILLSGTVVPFFTSIAYMLDFRPEGFIDLTPLGFLIMSVILAYGAVSNKLFEMTPIVLNYLYEMIPDAIFVLDRNSNIINTNPSAQRLLNSGIMEECLKNDDCLHYEDLPDIEETQNKEVKAGDKYFYITRKAVTEGNNKQIGLMLIVKDVTELKNLEHMQELLMSIALNFINTPLDEYEKTVYVSLEKMGGYVNAERAYVVNYNYSKGIINLIHEWRKQGVSSIFNELQNINLDAIKELIDIHNNRESFFVEDMQVLLEGSPLYESLKFSKEKSFLAIPMFEGSSLIGFLGFDWLYKNHKYSHKEQQLLQLFAEILVNLISRKEVNKIIKQQAEVERLTAEISSDFVRSNSQNIQEVITKTLEKLGRFMQVDSAFVFEFFEGQDFQIREWSLIPRNKPQQLALANYSWLNRQLGKGMLRIDKVEEMPHEAEAERNDLIAWGIKSMISIAIRNNNQTIGTMGFQMLSHHRRWNDEDANLLKIFSNIIGEAMFKVEREKELIQAKNMAESASKAKSEFLSNTSHEIRTPLNGMIGFTELLRNTKLNKVQLEYVENAIMSANTLMAVINDILDFSKIESGKLELDIVHTDIVQLVEKASDIVKIMASQKGLELLLNIQPDTPRYAYVDPIRLKQIMVNLLSNAVKFTTKGEVEISLRFK
ncbi:MAG: histidine kinase N-terminal 7TM domain-containing protein, partial [Bacteroidales bacterium]|nr:histidine kinase N-terminal 7TM domain-containing protein [Bacteroidales bacterium]